MNTTLGTVGGDDLVQAALRVAKAAAERRLRHQAEADLVRHKYDGIFGHAEKSRQPARFHFGIALRQHQVRQPQGQAIHQHGAAMGCLPGQCIDQRQRLLDGNPAVATPLTMMGDARPHLVIACGRGGEVDPRKSAVSDQLLGKGGFAGARAAQHQRGGKRRHFGALPSSGDQRIGGTRATMPLRSTSARSRHGTRP